MHLPSQIPSIAMLHSVGNFADESLGNWCISHKAFLQLLTCIEEQEYHTTHFSELLEEPNTGKQHKKKVILTFDDCPKHLFDFAIPELLKRDMKAAFYMPAA